MSKIFIAAGGTAGHINAALSIGEELSKDNEVYYLSGERHLDLKLFKNNKCFHISSRPLRVTGVFKKLINLFMNVFSLFQILKIFLLKRPKYIIGAGGYICGPSLIVGKLLLIPIFIIEQNAVAGMTNQLLSKLSNLTFLNFQPTKGLESLPSKKVRVCGNPIRSNIHYVKNEITQRINILVFGGSLGAVQINKCIQGLVKSSDQNINITHQVGKNNQLQIEQVCPNINYEQVEYIDDMQLAYNKANIIICRAGASSISELRVIRKPAILIPFPGATDNHQYHNAMRLKDENPEMIYVADHTLSDEDLLDYVEKTIKLIIDNKRFYSNEKKIDNAALKIITEIENYVRN